MTSSSLVYKDGNYVREPLYDNPYYMTGYPIAEAYWTNVNVAGTPHLVLLQCFERRCLTYTPDNAPGWQVEAGNVGQHYYRWRHGEPHPTEDVSIYLVAIGDDGATGIQIGCGDSLVPVTVQIPQASTLEERIQSTLEYLFGLHDRDYGESGLITALYQSDLTVDDVSVADGTATVALSGTLASGGVCDDPRIAGQIEYTIKQFAGIENVVVTLNGQQIIPPLPPTAEQFEVQFHALNDSNVGATADLTLDGDQLHIVIHAQGLDAGQHAMHIHGFANGSDAVCPTPAAAGGDGILTNDEGMAIYGNVLIELTPTPVVGDNGNLSYNQTLTLSQDQLDDLGDLTHNTIVIHGLDQDDSGSMDADEQMLPIACGTLEPASEAAPLTYTLQLGTLNDSGVTGSGTLSLDGNTLHVTLDVSGLETGQHMMHIHGHPNDFDTAGDVATCPTPDLDDNGNGVIELAEGLPAYGDVLLTLAMSMANDEGEIHLDRTFIVDAALVGPLENRVVVVHGMTVDLDGDMGDDPAYDASVPVACGLIAANADALTNDAMTFTADLTGAHEQPPVVTDATGSFVARLDATGATISWQLIVNDIDGVTSASINEGSTSQIGDAIVTLLDTEGTPFEGTGQVWSGAITEDSLTDADFTFQELVDLMTAGGTYVNVQTSDYPNGEIRGQITPVEPTP